MRLLRKWIIRLFFTSIVEEILAGEQNIIWGRNAEFRVDRSDMTQPTLYRIIYDGKIVAEANIAHVIRLHYSDDWGKPLLRQYRWKRYWRLNLSARRYIKSSFSD